MNYVISVAAIFGVLYIIWFFGSKYYSVLSRIDTLEDAVIRILEEVESMQRNQRLMMDDVERAVTNIKTVLNRVAPRKTLSLSRPNRKLH